MGITMKRLCTICARGGSKGLPGKNTKNCNINNSHCLSFNYWDYRLYHRNIVPFGDIIFFGNKYLIDNKYPKAQIALPFESSKFVVSF